MTDKTPVTSPTAPPAGPYSPGLAVGEWVLLACQTGPWLPERRLRTGPRAHSARSPHCSARPAARPQNVVSCLVHLADLSDFQRFNAVYERHFPEPRPIRTTVGAALLGGAKVEITAVACQPARP